MEINHRVIGTNGIKMHITEQGEGTLVIMCHGFPELGYSWRHQLTALAEAGFHAVSPDQRGYGRTDCPEPVEAYNILQLVGDMVGLVHAPDSLPDWLTEEDVNVFTEAFERTGFRGGVNWYRNIDRNWELTPFLSGARILQPSLFLAGELDGVITMSRGAFDNLEKNMPNLRQKILIPGAGHWIQQKRPREVNDALIDFLKSVT